MVMDDATQNEADKRFEAVLGGIAGQAKVDEELERVIFWPSKTGRCSQAYLESLAEVGDEWDEWVFEVDIEMRQEGGVVVINL
jgi:hypothetical protein